MSVCARRGFVWVLCLLAAAAAAGSAPQETPATARPAARPATRRSPRPTPTPQPLLEGVVLGPQEKPVEGALVSVRPTLFRQTDTTRSAKTNGGGRFQLTLLSTVPHDVGVEAPGLAPGRVERVRPGASVVVRLTTGRTISGVVRDEAGQPIAGARVTSGGASLHMSAWHAESPANETKTDSRGRFRLGGIAPGLQRLVAVARGYGRGVRNNVQAGASIVLTLRRGGWVEGILGSPEGRPVAGAQVRAEPDPHSWIPGSPTEHTDATGRFELLGLPAGQYTVVANHPDFAPAVMTGVAVADDGPSAASLAFSPHAAVAGRLVNHEGQGVPGRVEVQEVSGRAVPRSLVELMRSDSGPDGCFRIDRVALGSWSFGVKAPGFAAQRIDASVSGRQGLVDLGEVLLERGLTLRGRVRTPSGEPVALAQIDAYQREAGLGGNEVETQSAADGSFLLAGLSPGHYQLYVRAPGFASRTHEVASGGDNVDVILAPGGSISGVVVEEGDRPVDSYFASASPDAAGDRRWEGRGSDSVGSADGRFLVADLAEGTYVVEIVAPERAPATVSGLAVAPGRVTDAGTIRLARGGIVRGSVSDADGRPIGGAVVQVSGPGASGFQWLDLFKADSDPAGGFEFRGVPEGTHSVSASHPDFAPAEVPLTVEPGKGPSETQLILSSGGRIEGIARKREGTPLAGLTVRAFTRGSPRTGFERPETTTRADGSFSLDHIAPGTVSLNLMVDSGAGVTTGVLAKTVEVRDGETATVEFVSREILVTGRVTRAGAPLPGVDLRLWSKSGAMTMYAQGRGNAATAPTGPGRMHAVTRDDGTFELLVDEPGTFSVNAQSLADSVRYPPRELAIPDVDTHAVELAFSGVSLAGVVVDEATGQPVAGADVWASPTTRAQDVTSARTASDGRFALDVDPGDYVVSARSDAHAESSLKLSIGEGGASDLRFELRPGQEIAGRVVDAAGRAVAGVQAVAASETEDMPVFVRTLADGSFRFGSLADVPYTICAGSDQSGYGVAAQLMPGRSGVTLALRPAGRVQLLVRGSDGAPVAEAYARISRLDGVKVVFPRAGGVTNPSGIVVLATPAGRLEITVAAGVRSGTARASVSSGETVEAEVTLNEAPE